MTLKKAIAVLVRETIYVGSIRILQNHTKLIPVSYLTRKIYLFVFSVMVLSMPFPYNPGLLTREGDPFANKERS